ncbi:hypothetical protein LTR86_000989 [Recurvomyces mirabilis]|nr:hypothetical protein LTR86_000989 [Recurvomyces mirabilis]
MVAFSQIALAISVTATTGFAAPASPVDAVLEARGDYNFVLGEDHPLALARRNASLEKRQNYVQNYHTGGTVNFQHTGDKFSLNYNVNGQDFVVGIGWNPGSNAPITHSGSFGVTSGLGTLSVYGWSTNPLVEYYVIEDSKGFTQTGTDKGTFTTDGSTYTVWENLRSNEPSIQGTSTFQQYISIRNSPRPSGTVTIANHFAAWKSHGMNLGTLNFQVIAVESWGGAGSASQTVTH